MWFHCSHESDRQFVTNKLNKNIGPSSRCHRQRKRERLHLNFANGFATCEFQDEQFAVLDWVRESNCICCIGKSFDTRRADRHPTMPNRPTRSRWIGLASIVMIRCGRKVHRRPKWTVPTSAVRWSLHDCSKSAAPWSIEIVFWGDQSSLMVSAQSEVCPMWTNHEWPTLWSNEAYSTIWPCSGWMKDVNRLIMMFDSN